MSDLQVTEQDVEAAEHRKQANNWGEGLKGDVEGAGVVGDIGNLAADASNGNWAEGLLDGAAVAGSVGTFAADPLAGLAAAGFGWLMEHVEFLKEPLDWLTGDQNAIKAASQTWGNVATELNQAGQQLHDTVKADTAPWHGPAIDAYVPAANAHAALVGATATAAKAASAVISISGQVLKVVRDVVRQLISKAVGDLVAAALEWAAAEVISVGLATPGMVADIVRRAVGWASRIMTWVKKITRVFHAAKGLLDKLKPLLDKLQPMLKKLEPALEKAGDTKVGQIAKKAYKPFDDGAEQGISRGIRRTYAKSPGYDEAGNLAPSHSRFEWPQVDPDALGKEAVNKLAKGARQQAGKDAAKGIDSTYHDDQENGDG